MVLFHGLFSVTLNFFRICPFFLLVDLVFHYVLLPDFSFGAFFSSNHHLFNVEVRFNLMGGHRSSFVLGHLLILNLVVSWLLLVLFDRNFLIVRKDLNRFFSFAEVLNIILIFGVLFFLQLLFGFLEFFETSLIFFFFLTLLLCSFAASLFARSCLGCS